MQRPPWLGKLIGGGLGLLAAGPFGAIVGLLIGHIVDSVQRVLTAADYRGIFSVEFKRDPRDGTFRL